MVMLGQEQAVSRLFNFNNHLTKEISQKLSINPRLTFNSAVICEKNKIFHENKPF